MLQSFMRIAGVDLQQQLAGLRAQAEDFKDRTIDDVKGRVVDTAVMIGLAAVGGMFLLITFGIALIALYRWIGILYGPFWGLGAVALLTTTIAIVLFVVAMNRGKRRDAEREALAEAQARLAALQVAAESARASAMSAAAEAEAAHSAAGGAYGGFGDGLNRTTAATGDAMEAAADFMRKSPKEAMDFAADFVRKSPKEAVLATVALAAIAGVFLGRKR